MRIEDNVGLKDLEWSLQQYLESILGGIQVVVSHAGARKRGCKNCINMRIEIMLSYIV